MILRDRIEVWNPGSLPLGWTTEKLKILHSSVPANPLLAEPMYLAGYIERMGTGTSDMVKIARKNNLKEPEFIQEDSFVVKVYRPEQFREQEKEQEKEQVGEQDTPQEELEITEVDFHSIFGVNAEEFRSIFGVNIYKTLCIIVQNPDITAKSLGDMLNLTTRTIENYIAKLKSENYIKRVGSDKTGSWKIIRQRNN